MDFESKLISLHTSTETVIQHHRDHISFLRQSWLSHMNAIKETGSRVIFARDMSHIFTALEKEILEVQSLNLFFKRNIINRPSTLEFEEVIFEKTGNTPPIFTSLSNYLQRLEEKISNAQAFMFPSMPPYESKNVIVTRLIQDYLKVA